MAGHAPIVGRGAAAGAVARRSAAGAAALRPSSGGRPCGRAPRAPRPPRWGPPPSSVGAPARASGRAGAVLELLGRLLDLAVRLRRPRRVDARLEHRHQVDQLAAGRRRLGLDDLATLDLGLDDLLERGAVLVAVLGRVELAGHRRDELLRHRPLGRLDLDVLAGEVELVGRPDLVGPVEGLEDHRVAVRLEGGERLAVLDDDLADGGEPLLGEHLAQEGVGLLADRLGLDVVGLLHEARRLGLLGGRGGTNFSISIDRTVLSGTLARSSSVMTTYWSFAYS